MTAAPLALLLCSLAQSPATAEVPKVDFEPWQKNIERFEPSISKIEAKDQALYDAGGPPEGAALLAGSSSVRIWMEADEPPAAIAPVPVIARGYGGARFSDFAYFADRLFEPHLTPDEPGANVSAIVLFVGNDITGGLEQKPGAQTPEGAAAYVRHTIAVAQKMDADVPVLLLAVTPSERRWDTWPRIQKFNQQMKQIAAETDGVHYLNTAPSFLGEDGTPKSELFRNDQLHLSAAGYEVWAELIKTKLAEIAGDAE